MGGEHRGGVRAKRGAGPAGRCPTPRHSLTAGGKASGRRRCFQNKEMRRGTRGTGVVRKAEEVRLRPSGRPLPLQSARRSSPHPQPELRCRRRGRRLR